MKDFGLSESQMDRRIERLRIESHDSDDINGQRLLIDRIVQAAHNLISARDFISYSSVQSGFGLAFLNAENQRLFSAKRPRTTGK